MEAAIYNPFSWKIQDLSQFLDGTERQGFELTMNIVSTNKWDYAIDDYQSTGESFEDANLTISQTGYTATEYISVSGYMHDLD